jgi:glycosyltransferase involved in cell wall biosynthesis
MNKSDTGILLIESRAARAPRGGVARYIRHIAAGLHARYGDQLVVCSGLTDLPSSIHRLHLPLRYPWRYSSRLLYRVTSAWEKLLLRRVERRLKPDVIFSPLFGPLASETPQVFTVYDLRIELFPEHFPSKGRLLEVEHMRRCFVNAAAIICISNSTRNDLLRFHPDLDPQKVHAVPLGVSEEFLEARRSTDSSRQYFLFVGNRSGTKNFLRLLEAFAISGLSKDYDLRVISPGFELAKGWSESEQRIIRSNALENSLKLTVRASEADLVAAYAGAAGFVFPSEHEGFGLPILEALAAGTIVACSKTSSLPEAGGAAALYFDPSSVESISQSMIDIAEMDSTERAQRIADGVQHAKSLSWSKCVSRTSEILESVAQRN